MRTAIYPGTFDPFTNGHLDVLSRACHMFDRVICAVAPNLGKGPVFSVGERMRMIEENLLPWMSVEVASFEGLLVDFARARGAVALVRGLRAVSDFEYEFQMAQINRDLDPDLETVFFMPSQDYFYTSSNLVKQVARHAPERVEKLVPANVLRALVEKFARP